jgi:hypothetical protein
MNPTDPLSQLRDIHLPDPITWWPPAIGWWIVTLILIVAIAGSIYWVWRRYQRLAYKREALKHMESVRARYLSHRDDAQLLSELSALLKRISITRYGREEIAGLTGSPWLEFLDRTGNTQEFTDGSGRALASERFNPAPKVDSTELMNIAQQWITKQK